MKSLPAIAAASIAVALLLVPLAATAAGTLTITSPTAGASYKGSVAYTISGTISPVPSQADNVAIVVKNPSNQVVDQGNPSVTSGAFSYSTAVGGTAAWVTGTYTITATDTFGATASTSFSYTATSAASYNITRALVNIQGNLTIINKEIKNLNNDLNGNVTAIKATQTTQGNAITSLQNSVASITSSLNSLSQAVSGLQSSVTSIGTQVGSINTAVQGLSTQVSTAAANAQNAANAVSSTQTYVLVVAVLAAITLVLELAILVRKLS